jgi:ribonuclease HI
MSILKQFGIDAIPISLKQTKINLSDFDSSINNRLEMHGIISSSGNAAKNDLHVFSNAAKNDLHVFIDGSAIGNGSKSCRAGYAAVFPNHPHLTISEPLKSDHRFVATNNRAEYMACIVALEQANIEDPQYNLMLSIHTDSKLLMDSMTKWIKNWKRNNWKKSDGHEVLNRDLLERLDRLLSFRRVYWKHVKAHTGGKDYFSVWNDKADEMAKNAVHLKI